MNLKPSFEPVTFETSTQIILFDTVVYEDHLFIFDVIKIFTKLITCQEI